ncbi:MAG: EamA family transporter [Bacteroidota bacterium]
MSDRWLVIGAFAAVYFIWGSTYLFNYWAIESIPPFFMSGTRFLTAGLLLYIWGQFRGEPLPNSKHWWNSFWIGNLFLTIGTGAVVWALQYIDTGIAALIVATDPLLIMMLLWWLFQQRPRWQGLVGAGIGIIGTIILVGQPKFTDSPEARWGLVAIAVALTAWAFASIYVSRIDLPESRLRRSSLQMLGGGAGLLAFSTLTGEAATFRFDQLTSSSFFSWCYLIVFGSIVAFSSFNYLLARVSPEKVATSTYVNPVVALLLGWGFNGEQISSQSLIAGVVLLTGVFFINTGKGQADEAE